MKEHNKYRAFQELNIWDWVITLVSIFFLLKPGNEKKTFPFNMKLQLHSIINNKYLLKPWKQKTNN